jgi:hypothetical protein
MWRHRALDRTEWTSVMRGGKASGCSAKEEEKYFHPPSFLLNSYNFVSYIVYL